MPVIKLLSWRSEIAAKTTWLNLKETTVDATPLLRTSAVIDELARLNPAVLVLDLDRMPSGYRENRPLVADQQVHQAYSDSVCEPRSLRGWLTG